MACQAFLGLCLFVTSVLGRQLSTWNTAGSSNSTARACKPMPLQRFEQVLRSSWYSLAFFRMPPLALANFNWCETQDVQLPLWKVCEPRRTDLRQCDCARSRKVLRLSNGEMRGQKNNALLVVNRYLSGKCCEVVVRRHVGYREDVWTPPALVRLQSRSGLTRK